MLAELASRHSSLVVLENLNHLRRGVNGNSSFNKKFSLWFYRSIRFAVGYEALERSLEVKYVNPRNTSSKCHRCGFAGDKDVIECIDLFLRYLKCEDLEVSLNAPKGDANPRPMQRKRDEAMTSTDINLYES